MIKTSTKYYFSNREVTLQKVNKPQQGTNENPTNKYDNQLKKYLFSLRWPKDYLIAFS